MNHAALKRLEADLWRSADTLRANSDLKASEYSTPVLGLIFGKLPVDTLDIRFPPAMEEAAHEV